MKQLNIIILFMSVMTPVLHAYQEVDINYFDNNHRNGKKIVTFLGFSARDYENKTAMLHAARKELEKLNNQNTIINIGASADGVGAIYELAQQLQFETSGIVSALCKDQCQISPHVQHVLFVNDATYGGYLPNSSELSPTSKTMVNVSDKIIALGGGQVAADELTEAHKAGKEIIFIDAEQNHDKARDAARRRNTQEPTDFKGEAYYAWHKIK